MSIMPRGQRRAKAPPPPEEEEEDDDDEVDVANDAGRRTAASLGLAAADDDYDDDEGGGGGGGVVGGGVGGGEEDEADDEEEEDPDASVLRILLSTDNHLGYLERDPIRGRDSFAAFEEVLSLARTHGVDMVLLSGDLFHENKPSRKTLHAVSSCVGRLLFGFIYPSPPAPRCERISGSGDDDGGARRRRVASTVVRFALAIVRSPPSPPLFVVFLIFHVSSASKRLTTRTCVLLIFHPPGTTSRNWRLNVRITRNINAHINPKRKRKRPNDDGRPWKSCEGTAWGGDASAFR